MVPETLQVLKIRWHLALPLSSSKLGIIATTWPFMQPAALQAHSPSAQGKAAAVQVGDLKWNGEKKRLLPTIRVGGTYG